MLDRIEEIYSKDTEIKYYIKMATDHMKEGQLDFALDIIHNILLMADQNDLETQRLQTDIIQNTKNIAIRFYSNEEFGLNGISFLSFLFQYPIFFYYL